jgi:predicted pyridoxine 5'-phosphate oxidase superfamily flavin-nucleotide-binding protein
MAFSMAMPWNAGEVKMHDLLRVPSQDNPTSTMLTPQASFMLQRGPLLALGTLDSLSRPWTTIWGGSPGFSEPLGGDYIGTRTLVDGKYDPVVQALVGGAEKEEMLQPKDGGKILSGLAFDLMTRKRVKICGKMVAGTVRKVNVKFGDGQQKEGALEKQDHIQLVVKIDQSMGNCPKYFNQYEVHPTIVQSKLLSEGSSLSDEGKTLIGKADMFFLSTSTEDDQDTNHRGGPPGFVRVMSPTQIIYPEYSGNRLYQSLGNLLLNPKVGITFPDYESGDVLYITGSTEILVGTDAGNQLPGSNLAVKITISEARFVQAGLPFRGDRKMPSPYNPRVRPLASEGNIKSALSTVPAKAQPARLVKKAYISPSVARFTFSVADGIAYSPGQWIALDFKQHFDQGYHHMREEDPTSLNDDYVRTFTISSAPKAEGGTESEFEITLRNVGRVTEYLFKQNERAEFEVPVLGVGGDFKIEQHVEGITPFIAGGVGITPLLGQLQTLNMSPGSFRLLWTLKAADIDLVFDVLGTSPALAKCTTVFFTGSVGHEDGKLNLLREMGVKAETRRLVQTDVHAFSAETWYLCAGKVLRREVLGWLEGRNVLFENFDY